MRRRLFTLLSALSLLLCVATCLLWVRGYFRMDTIYWLNERWSGWGITSKSGQVVVSTRHLDGLDNGPQRFRYYCISEPAALRLPLGMVRKSWAGFYFSDDSGTFANPFGRYTWRDQYYAVPDWFIVLLTGSASLLWLRWFVGILRADRRAARGCCAACGYNLRATPDRCPECGTVPIASK